MTDHALRETRRRAIAADDPAETATHLEQLRRTDPAAYLAATASVEGVLRYLACRGPLYLGFTRDALRDMFGGGVHGPDEVCRAALELATERLRREHTPLELLERAVRADLSSRDARDVVRRIHELERVPRGAAAAEERGRTAREEDALEAARATTPTHTDVDSARAAIEEALAEANGARRTRLLDLDDVLSSLGRVVTAEEDGYAAAASAPTIDEVLVAARTGGTVANAYGYPARTTTCAAARAGDVVAIDVGSADAKGGARHTPWEETAHERARRERVLRWIPRADIVLSRRVAWDLLEARS